MNKLSQSFFSYNCIVRFKIEINIMSEIYIHNNKLYIGQSYYQCHHEKMVVRCKKMIRAMF